MLGPKVPLSEKVLRRLCFVTGTSAQVTRKSLIEGLDSFGQETDDPKEECTSIQRWIKDARDEEWSCSKNSIITQTKQ